jgi:hypothetical protein
MSVGPGKMHENKKWIISSLLKRSAVTRDREINCQIAIVWQLIIHVKRCNGKAPGEGCTFPSSFTGRERESSFGHTLDLIFIYCPFINELSTFQLLSLFVFALSA